MAGRLTRFLNLEPRRTDDAPPHEVASKARFADLRDGSGLALDTSSDAMYLRCPNCGADNGRVAPKCFNCETRLGDLDVRMREEPAPEAPPAAALAPDQQRAYGEALAQMVAEAERARVGPSTAYTTPLGMRLLELIPNPNTRFAAAMGLVATFFGSGLIAFVERQHPVLQTVAIVVAVGLLVLFTPNRPRSRRRFWDDWD